MGHIDASCWTTAEEEEEEEEEEKHSWWEQLDEDNNLMAVKQREQALTSARKLLLCLDIDQTLLFSSPVQLSGLPLHDHECTLFGPKQEPFAQPEKRYIYLRPGVKHFLQQLASLFEFYVYTMGTREHAMAVLPLLGLDSCRRVLSRDESPDGKRLSTLLLGDRHGTSMWLSTLFSAKKHVLVDMAVIVDDNPLVWTCPLERQHVVSIMAYDVTDVNKATTEPEPLSLPKAQAITRNKRKVCDSDAEAPQLSLFEIVSEGDNRGESASRFLKKRRRQEEEKDEEWMEAELERVLQVLLRLHSDFYSLYDKHSGRHVPCVPDVLRLQ